MTRGTNPAFVVSPSRPFGLSNINIPANGPTINPVGMSANDFVRSLALEAASRVAPVAADAAGRAVQNFADRVTGGVGGNTGSGAPGSRSRGGTPRRGSRSRNFSSNGVNQSNIVDPSIGIRPDNAPVTWTTGIKSGTNVNGRQSETYTYTPLYMQCGCFFPSSDYNDDSSFYGELLGQDIYRETISNIQRSVNYRSDRDFSKDQFYEYLELIVNMLQLYYMVDSILVTCNHNSRNRGIFRLREKLTSDILLQHIRLKEFLQTCPIPPNLLNFIRYMYQCHSSGMETDAPIIRLCYMNSLLDDVSNDLAISADMYRNLINQANDVPFTRLMSLLARAMPEWINSEMPYSTYEYIYDPQFLTFWFNCATTCSNDGEGILHVKSIANDTEQYEYYQFTREVDGGIYACCSAYLTEKARYESGLWIPITQFDELMDRGNCTSLLMFRENQILGVTSLAHRVAAKVYLAPHVVDNDPDNHGWSWEAVGDCSGHLLQSHCMSNIQQPLSEFIRHLFRP